MGSYDSAWKNNLSSLGMSFYAQWKTATPKSKYIHYDANGGSGFMASTEVPSGNTSATLSKNLFTRAGHDFAGWKDETGTSYSDRATVTGITGDKTMYAQWNPYTYTLQFAYDDVRVRPVEVIAEKTLTFAEEVGIPGEPHEMSSTVSYNTNLTTQSTRNLFSWITAQPLSASYTKAEADFKGWALYRKDGSLYNYLGRYFEYTPGESRTVYGLTEVKNDVLTMFPDWNGGFVLLPNAKLPGYTLEGWMDAPTEASAAEIAYLESEADGEGGFYEPKLNEETLYALWTPNKYKVALVSDYEGSSVTSLGGTTGDTYVWMTFDAICPSVTAPTLPRYVFKGYYTEPNGQGTMYYGPADKTTGVSAAENNMVWTIYDGSVDTLYAYWIPDKAITYEPNYSPPETGCKAAWTEYIDTDGAYWTLAANEFTRLGYHFVSWNTKADGSGTTYADRAQVATANINGIVPLYAQWAPNTYTLAYDLPGNRPNASTTAEHATPTPPATATYNKSIEVHNPSRVGYTFLGWNITGMDTCTHTYGGQTTNATSLTNSKVYGYKNLRSTAGTVTFTAQWSPITYSLTYDLAGNKPNATTTAVHATPTPPATATFDKSIEVHNPSRVGYTFLGWNITGMDTCTHTYGGQTTNATSLTNSKVYGYKNLRSTDGTVAFAAQWANNKYKVTLDVNGGTANSAYTGPLEVTFDESTNNNISTYKPSRTGYTFQGWYTAKSGGVMVYTAAGACTNEGTYWKNNLWCGTSDVTLYARWKANAYTMTIYGNKGSGSTDVTVPYSTVTMTFDSTDHYYNGSSHSNYLAGNLATRQGYTLDGYYTSASGGIQLYNSAGAIMNSGTVAYSGYTTGYYFYQGKYKIAGNLDIFAHWKPNTYTVTLDLNAPGAIPAARISHESFNIVFDTSGHIYGGSTHTDYLAGNIPSRAGYIFDGWYTAASGGTKVYHADGSITNDGTYFRSGVYVYPGNVTLYAHWTPLKYTMTLDGNKGSGSTDVTVPYSTVTMTFDSTDHYYNGSSHSNYLAGDLAYRKGYELTGYYTAATGGMKIYTAAGSLAAQTLADNRAETVSGYYFHTGKWKVVGNLTLYAQWKPLQYPVILDDRGATSTGHTEEVLMTFDQVGPDIIVPEKTGYTFHGYYTEIRGAGTKYYDEAGKCVKTWTETDVNVLYAYWTQNPVELPEEEEHPEPTVLPEKEVEGSVGRTDSRALLYADDYNPATGALDDLQPYLTYDTPGSEGVIPGTEFLSFRARLGSWMLNYKFHRYSGKDMVRIKVSVTYRTQYERPDEELVISDLQFKEYDFLVPKAWYYWSVAETGMYYPDKVIIENEALKGGKITVPVNRESDDAPQIPEYTVTCHGDRDAHIRWENYDADGVPLLYLTLAEEEYIISDVVNTLPNVDRHLSIVCKNAAWKDDRKAEVRSDGFTFAGETILSDEWLETNGAELDESKLDMDAEDVELTSYLQTYQSGIEMDEKKPNGRFSTTAVITYVGDTKNVGADPTKEEPLTDINGLNIHTPVVCDGVAVDGVEDGVLTLKDALNFFTLRVDNTGTHRMSLGYGTKDFAFALSGKSNVAEQDGSYLNQVKFPFDVYVDMGTDSLNADGTYSTAGDYYFEAGTWLTISDQDKRFYVPVTQEEGEYEISFRTIAVNCPMADDEYDLYNTAQSQANVNPADYVASDSMKLILVLALEDFDIINTNDPSAKEELATGNQALVLKKGYKFAYKLSTIGTFINNDCETRIVPSFYYISKDEKERFEADIYYNEVIGGQKRILVLAGDAVDSSNIHMVKNNSPFLTISDSVLAKTQGLSGINPFVGVNVGMYTYKNILLDKYVKMFIGLDITKLPVKYCRECHLTYCENESVACGHALNVTTLYTMAERAAQEWYGEFALPMDSYVLVKGTKTGLCDICNTNRYIIGEKTIASCGHSLSNLREFDIYSYAQVNTLSGSEEFFKHDGYLAVSFEIQVKADSGEWYTFNNWAETELYNDFIDKARYVQGDVVWYNLSESSGDDYEVGGVE